jgi:hypothetical protein
LKVEEGIDLDRMLQWFSLRNATIYVGNGSVL